MQRYYVEKDPDSLLDYAISFDTWLQAAESITSHVWTVPAGITKDHQTDAARVSTVWLDGGTLNTVYTINLHIVTSLLREEDRELIVWLTPSVRAGMIPLIIELRSLTNTAMGDTTINDIPYWSDYQLQGILDRNATQHIDVQLIPIPQYGSSSTEYFKYKIPDEVGKWIETGASLSVVDQQGVSVAHTIDTVQGYVTFSSNTDGEDYFIRCTSYNMRLAAARVWLDKASHRVELIDWKAGGQTLDEDQAYQHCLERAAYFAGSSGLSGVLTGRSAGGVIRLKKVGYGTLNSRVTDNFPYSPDGNTSPVA